MRALTRIVSTRISPAEELQLKQLSAANGLSPSTAQRLAINLLVEKAAAENGQIAEPALSSQGWRRKLAADRAIFDALAHPILIGLNCSNRYQRVHIMNEVASTDRSLVSTVARAADLGVNCTELLTAVFTDFLQGEPAAQVWPVTRQQLVWLEYQWNVSRDKAAVSSAVDRLDDKGRWIRMRTLMKIAAEAGVQVSDIWTLTDDGWTVAEMRYMRKVNRAEKGRGTERLWEETSEPPPPPITLGEEMCMKAALRSPKIGGDGKSAPRARNMIRGDK